MVTRIGDSAQNNRMTSLLMQAQTRSRVTQAQISTGKVADRFQELGTNSARLVNIKNVLQQTVQYQQSNGIADRKLGAMEQAVSSLFDIASRVQTMAMQRANTGSATPGAMAAELESLLDGAVTQLNSRWDGQHLFAGSRTDTPPVQIDPSFADLGNPDTTYYQGDQLTSMARIDQNVEVPMGMPADREGFQQLIGGLRALINGDSANDKQMLEQGLELVNQSLTQLTDYQAEIGSRQSTLDLVNRQHADAELYLEMRVSDIENIDVTEAITRLTQDQMILESAMATMGRLNRLSLADYL